MRSKSETFLKFKVFKTMTDAAVGKKIRILRTDRGGKFFSQSFADFLELYGIRRHLTQAKTPA